MCRWRTSPRSATGPPTTASPRTRRRFLERGPRRGWALVAEKIRDGQRRGELRAHVDAERAARLLVSGLGFQTLLLSRSGPAGDVEEALREAMKTVAALLER
ncbi:MAG: TetR/AcrR family transcriptional regulator C-terminal domain-containing protein [Polyangiaceae bacterium]